MVAGSTSETEIIESHRFSFWCMGRWLAALRRPVLISNMRILGPPLTPAPNVSIWHRTDMPTLLSDVRYWMNSGKHVLTVSFSGFDARLNRSTDRALRSKMAKQLFLKHPAGLDEQTAIDRLV
jgi:hypothetical protein